MSYTYKNCPHCKKGTQSRIHIYHENGEWLCDFECILCGSIVVKAKKVMEIINEEEENCREEKTND